MAEPPVQPRDPSPAPGDASGASASPTPSGGVEAPGAATEPVHPDPLSAMAERFNLFFRFFAHRFFRHFDLDADTVERLRDLERRGTVVYVMRYASRLDYFLFNCLFRREGLRLSSFANGIRFYYYRPWLEALKIVWRRPRGVPQDVELVRTREYARNLTREGASFFLFFRTTSLRTQLRSRRNAIAAAKSERDLLSEVVRSAWESERPVHVVPLALFWRKGPRARRRFLNLSYGATTRPSDLAKVTSFLVTYRGLHVKVADPIDVQAFSEGRREHGPASVARMLQREVLTYLYREEKVVEGPVLQPRHRVQEIVVRDPAVRAAIAKRVREKNVTRERARLEAERMFREIAANMNSTFLALLAWLVGGVTSRLFSAVEVSGLEKVTEYAKRNPIVLVPSHRSYFDFLILSLLFYDRHIIPPHIAARENMAFGPFGFLWRRAGAFFLRRSFDDPLYKAVFRTYVGYLIKEGFTQEFFIEGGRSRTGKTLAPRLGMLAWDVEAFVESGRRDLFFVPIAITYERLVEEGAMVGELEGEQKSDESMLGLMRARKFLKRRFGSVFVSFGEPISLGDALGERRARFAREETPELAEERRAFVEEMGTRIAERINWAVAASATAVAACALLGERRRGLFRDDLVRRMQQVLDLLRLQDVRLTPELSRDAGDFHESIASLLRMDLIRSTEDPRGEILYYEPGRRRALDLYRNGILHFLAAPSFMALHLLSGASEGRLRRELSSWLDLFGRELFVQRARVLAVDLPGFLDHFEREGWIRRDGDVLRATPEGREHLRFLAQLTRPLVEAYFSVFAAASGTPEDGRSAKELEKAAADHFERASLLGEVGLAESSNPVTFGNALDLLVRRQVLETREAPGGGERRDRRERRERREKRYGRGPAFDELPALFERLEAALSVR